MENSEEILQILNRFTEEKSQQIPKQLDTYLEYVARTGDSVFNWANIKYLLREKLLHAIKNFNANTNPVEDIPNYPNVDQFNYEAMESMLLERFELFNAAPFTIQRLCELLMEPRKHYSRIDKYMRALEKNILVVSTVEPGRVHENSNGENSFDTLDDVDIELDEQEERTVIAIATQILAENKMTTVTTVEKELSPKRNVKFKKDEGDDDEQDQPECKKSKLEKEETLDQDEEEESIQDINPSYDEGTNNKNDTFEEIADDTKDEKQLQKDEVQQSKKDENSEAAPAEITSEIPKNVSDKCGTVKSQNVENEPISNDKEEDKANNELIEITAEQTVGNDYTSAELKKEEQAEMVGDATEDSNRKDEQDEDIIESGGRTVTYTTEIDTPEAAAVVTHHVIEVELPQSVTDQKTIVDTALEVTPEIPVQLDVNTPGVVNAIDEQCELIHEPIAQKTEEMDAEEITTTEAKSNIIEDITATTDSEMITDSNEAKLIDNMDIDGDNSQNETMDVL